VCVCVGGVGGGGDLSLTAPLWLAGFGEGCQHEAVQLPALFQQRAEPFEVGAPLCQKARLLLLTQLQRVLQMDAVLLF